MCVKRDLFKKQLKYRDGNNLLLVVVGGMSGRKLVPKITVMEYIEE